MVGESTNLRRSGPEALIAAIVARCDRRLASLDGGRRRFLGTPVDTCLPVIHSSAVLGIPGEPDPALPGPIAWRVFRAPL